MVLEEIDSKLKALAMAGHTVVAIRLGQDIVPVFIAEMVARGEAIPLDGSPTSYAGVPVKVGAINPAGLVIESDPPA